MAPAAGPLARALPGAGAPLALAQDNARLRAQVQGVLELLGVAAHELGNPLWLLQLRLRRLRSLSAQDPRLQEGLALAEREMHRLGQLLHNLLDLSHLSSNALHLEREELDLAALVREVAERFAEPALAAGCVLRVHAEEAVPGRWDRQRLERVATNLLSNALQFGRGQPIDLRVHAEGPQAHLTVRDHGVGIPPEAQPRLFGRFERVGGTGGPPGFGLGLYIVRQLVEAHGGSIHVTSRPGEGAAFTLVLPRMVFLTHNLDRDIRI